MIETTPMWLLTAADLMTEGLVVIRLEAGA
jgi:hypothetical protein